MLDSAGVFPEGFLWGAATAAYQVEGAAAEDGRCESIWDVFSRTPGRTVNGDTGDVAANHYHLLDVDLALMTELNLDAYRFSVSWPRIIDDDGAINRKGIDFYERLVDGLLDRGITPFLTLYHWDLPQRLEDRGGWANRDTAQHFADYAQVVHEALGDRVHNWTTLNEPYCASLLGYGAGVHAPGRREPKAAAAAVHHLLLAHGMARSIIRGDVGITLNLYPVQPVNPYDAQDIDAARRVDGLQNRLFLDPVLRGEYPADVLEDLAPLGFADHIRPGDLNLIGAPLDTLGVNYYTGHHVTGHVGDRTPEWIGSEHVHNVGRGLPTTAMGWEELPDGLFTVLNRLHDEYPRLPIHITENGAAYDDTVVDGRIDDHARRRYFEQHLGAVRDAIAAGVDVRGYFAWSLLDNFEWAEGYAKRFGIAHVDFDTFARTPKLSGRWYATVARANALPE
ncbi:GH1 family beta-glucosidase [Kutzneria sp. 744]|uniref:GH1 family beta-glucosidase n=1 Tax=Kutzneria sp. (strain 744) TaxID=345341 RepID=UPI0003EECC80|nr:GH1 family beta-glucosidase [Kutzneria sp. 744]EWM19236.1 beta-glucosidase [Kutzneria sp. 744]